MRYRDWMIVAFILSMFMSICALWAADMQTRRQAAATSLAAVKISLTPFERYKARAIDKAKQAGLDPRWIEGGR